MLRLIAPNLSALLLFTGAANILLAQDARHSFKLSIAATVDMEIEGMKSKLVADTLFLYTWRQEGKPQQEHQRTLLVDGIDVRVRQDDKQLMNVAMSRARFVDRSGDKPREVPFDEAPEALKTILRDAFGVPLCKRQLDGDLKEIKREIIVPDAVKSFILETGTIQNAVLFHPPFPRWSAEWTNPTEMSLGNSGFSKGKLAYKLGPVEKKHQLVHVSGTLTNDKFRSPTGVTLTNVKHVVSGTQNFDPATREWTSGKLNIDASFDLGDGDKPIGSAKGKMVITLESIPEKAKPAAKP